MQTLWKAAAAARRAVLRWRPVHQRAVRAGREVGAGVHLGLLELDEPRRAGRGHTRRLRDGARRRGGGGRGRSPSAGESECRWISGPGYGYWLCVTG